MQYIGLGSYAYRYAIKFIDHRKASYMTIFDFLEEASRLNFKAVQLCENFDYKNYSKEKLKTINRIANELGLIIELGLSGLSKDNLLKHLEIANLLSSNFIRVVLSNKGKYPENKPNELMSNSINILKEILPIYREQNVFIGIENHFDLPTNMLVDLVRKINDEHVGLIFDTTNHLAFIEKPENTLKLFMPHLMSVHIKDYLVQKVEAGYLISGTILGEGRLKTKKMLNEIFLNVDIISIILEMTIRRKPGQKISEVILWEKNTVERSANYLNSICNDLKNSFNKCE